MGCDQISMMWKKEGYLRVSIGKAFMDHHDGCHRHALIIGVDQQGVNGWIDQDKLQPCCQSVVDHVSVKGTLKTQSVVFTAVASRGWTLAETRWAGFTRLGSIRLILVMITPTLINPVLKIGLELEVQ